MELHSISSFPFSSIHLNTASDSPDLNPVSFSFESKQTSELELCFLSIFVSKYGFSQLSRYRECKKKKAKDLCQVKSNQVKSSQ